MKIWNVHYRKTDGLRVLERGGVTLSCGYDPETEKLHIGVAVCCSKDHYHKRRGASIASGRRDLGMLCDRPDLEPDLYYRVNCPAGTPISRIWAALDGTAAVARALYSRRGEDLDMFFLRKGPLPDTELLQTALSGYFGEEENVEVSVHRA